MSKPTQSATRRAFLGAASSGALGFAASARSMSAAPRPREERLPREVWIATVSQDGLRTENTEQMIEAMLARMREAAAYEPDIVCLPEVFPFVNLAGGRPPVSEAAEKPIGEVSRPFAEFARRHRCYVICPTYTEENGVHYNAAVLIGRDGKLVGEYRKMHPTVGEMEAGVSPGPLDPPVFETDFGVIGCQICFDIEWDDGWEALRKAGAEIVFWPSAFAGGYAVNAKAWRHRYCVVSSTRKDRSKICDISGEEIATSGRYQRWACAPVNLEKAFLHTWPFCLRFHEVQAKYGRDIVITTFHEEEWSIIESRSPDVKVADVLKEFEFETYAEHIRSAAEAQEEARRRIGRRG